MRKIPAASQPSDEVLTMAKKRAYSAPHCPFCGGHRFLFRHAHHYRVTCQHCGRAWKFKKKSEINASKLTGQADLITFL